MRKLLILATALTLVSGVALAETNGPDGQAPSPPANVGPGPGGPGGPGAGPDGPGGSGWRHGGPGWHHWGMMPWQRGGPGGRGLAMAMALSKGAHVVVERGRFGGRIDVKCAENDSTQDCVAAVESLISQLPMHHHGDMGGPGAPTTPPPAPPAP